MERINLILENINSVIVGKEKISKLILTAMLSEGHVLMEDVPGVGKTTFANAFARTFDCKFSRIQFNPDTMPGDILGSSIYNFETHSFEYIEGAIMGNIILADEINRTSPKTQSAMLEAMEERQVTVDGKRHKLPYPFVVIATQNPLMQKGTYYLPESQLDRFMMKLSVGYPDIDESVEIVTKQIEGKNIHNLKKIMDEKQWGQLIDEVKNVNVSKELIRYAAECVELTRNDEQVLLGASPRALLAWIRAAKAYAFIEGRSYCIPDDLKKLADVVLAHRLILKQATLDNADRCREVIRGVLRKVKVPIGKN